MSKFAVKVTETLSRTYVLDANNYEEAEDIIKTARQNGEIILESDDIEETTTEPSKTFGINPISEIDERLTYFTKYEN